MPAYWLFFYYYSQHNKIIMAAMQLAKKVVSDSPGLVDFSVGLVNSVFNLPNGQCVVF